MEAQTKHSTAVDIILALGGQAKSLAKMSADMMEMSNILESYDSILARDLELSSIYLLCARNCLIGEDDD